MKYTFKHSFDFLEPDTVFSTTAMYVVPCHCSDGRMMMK